MGYEEGIFLPLCVYNACFLHGYVYIYNKPYEGKDGSVAEYYHCQNKQVIFLFFLSTTLIICWAWPTLKVLAYLMWLNFGWFWVFILPLLLPKLSKP